MGVALTRTATFRPSGNLQHDLLGPDCLTDAERPGERELLEGDLPAVAAPDGQRFQELGRRLVRGAEFTSDAERLPVERQRRSRPGVEDRDAHRGGVDQGLQVVAGALFVAVAAGVGDHHGGLGGEHGQRLLILLGELSARFDLGQEEVADALALMEHRGREERHHRPHGHRRLEIEQIR